MNPFTPTKQEVRNYNWGYSAGGPFIRDKLFWFTTFEQQRFTIGVRYRDRAIAALAGSGHAGRSLHLRSLTGSSGYPRQVFTTLWPATADR